jgi:hypothetical protein
MVSCGRLLLVQVVLSFLLSGIPNTAQGKNLGTIILKTGERYSDTEYAVDKLLKLIVITHEGEERIVSFSDIQAIYSPSGNDITDFTLGDEYEKKEETWVSEKSAYLKKYYIKNWSVIIGIEGNFSVPIGNYFTGITSGFGYGANLRFALTEAVAIRFMVSRAGLKMGNELYEYQQAGFKFRTTRYLGGVDFYRHLNRQSQDISLWYGYAAMGVVNYTLSLGAVHVTESDYALGFGMGLILMLAPEIGFEGCAGLERLFVSTGEGSTYYGSGSAFIFDIKVGLTKFFAAGN